MDKPKKDVELLLKNGKPVQFPISGWSMYPFLSDGDSVTVSPINLQDLKLNQVVLYRRDNGPLVLHRIIDIKDDGLYLCGDNQFDIEGPLRNNQVFGKLVSFSHKQKLIQTDSFPYRVSSNCWRLLRPIRPVIAKAVHYLKKRL